MPTSASATSARPVSCPLSNSAGPARTPRKSNSIPGPSSTFCSWAARFAIPDSPSGNGTMTRTRAMGDLLVRRGRASCLLGGADRVAPRPLVVRAQELEVGAHLAFGAFRVARLDGGRDRTVLVVDPLVEAGAKRRARQVLLEDREQRLRRH